MKRQNQLNIKRGLLSKLVLLVALFLGSSNAWAEDEFTIGTGTSTANTVTPIYGDKVGTFLTKGEIIYLSSEISTIAGKEITKLSFQTNQASVSWGEAEFKVFLKETSQSTYTTATPTFIGDDDSVLFYEGGLSVTNNKLQIESNKNTFLYSGENNLVVGIYCTKRGTNAAITYKGTYLGYGKNQLIYYTGSSNSAYATRPNTTFTYNTPITSTLSIDPDEDIAFGVKWADGYKDVTITNNSGTKVNVVPTISGDDDNLFSVTNTEDTPITNVDINSEASATFRIHFTYNSSKLGDKAATITFTPDEDTEEAITKNISVTAMDDNDPHLSLSSDDGAFGTITTAGISKTYTVTNTGTGSMTVNIESSNSEYFILSTEKISDLGNGDSEEFTVTFNWTADVSKLGAKNGIITITPTYDDEDAITINATATAATALTLDETESTTIEETGSKSILLKYTPQDGWNTICMPFTLYSSYNSVNFMDAIFGTGWEAYRLSSYKNGVLTFTKQSSTATLGGGYPYLVYIEDAAVHADGIVVMANVTYKDPRTDIKEGDATFQGTFSPIGAGGLDGKYGITSESKLAKGNSSASIKGFRAYLEVTGDTPARIMTIDSEGETTDLGFVHMVDQEAKDVYNLQGQKVAKGRKGIYIVNGKKVVIK